MFPSAFGHGPGVLRGPMQNSSRLPVHTRPNISIASAATVSIETGFQNPSTAFESSECHLAVKG
jgi:hypothetical protein